MTPLDIIAQIIGLLVLPSALVVQSFKNMRLILIGELVLNLMVTVNLLLLGEMAGAVQCVAAAMHTVLLYAVRHRARSFSAGVTVAFSVLYVLLGLWTYTGPVDLLPMLSSLFFSAAVMQTRPWAYRLGKNLNASANLAYDLLVGAWGLSLTHGVLLLGGLLLSWRLDVRNKRGAPEEEPRA